jgi:1-acyl-sn-glycerol-3-phosphate acyltransferase
VDRGSGSLAPLQAALDALGDGEVVLVYPEATVTKNPDFMPMKGKTGTARLALDAGIPVLPVAVWGSQHIWQRAGHGDMRFGRPIWLKAGAPIDLSEYEASKDSIATLRTVTNRIMAEIRTLVVDMASTYPKRWA